MPARSDRSNRARSEEPPRDGGPAEAANFIAASVAELALLSRQHGHDILGFLLDMAQMEADQIGRDSQKRNSP